MTNFGGYMNFVNEKFYLEFFDVKNYWIGGTVIGGLVPFSAFLVAMFGWIDCQHLWTANEDKPFQSETRNSDIDWRWLKYT
jgi:hypothetical protein